MVYGASAGIALTITWNFVCWRDIILLRLFNAAYAPYVHLIHLRNTVAIAIGAFLMPITLLFQGIRSISYNITPTHSNSFHYF